MPFTLAHPAIVLPLIRKKLPWISSTAIIIGSLTPDFEEFLFFNDRKNWGHTWLGVFWFDLPVGFCMMFLYHNWVKKIFLPFLPAYITKRIGKYRDFNWNKYFFANIPGIMLSLIIGVMSHLLWDAFTHMNLLHPHGLDSSEYLKDAQKYWPLQAISSIAGMVYCAYVFHRRHISNLPPSNSIETKKLRPYYWIGSIFLVTTVFCSRLYFLTSPPSYITYINYSISGIVYAMLMMPLLSFLFLPGKKFRSNELS